MLSIRLQREGDMDELIRMTATEIVARLRRREISPLD